MKKINALILALLLLSQAFAQNPILTIDLNKKGVPVSPTLYGAFFEDINFGADGGLYAELIRNRSFEEGLSYWNVEKQGSSIGNIDIETKNLLNDKQTKCLKIVADKIDNQGIIGISNNGFWGINVIKNTVYELSFFAKSDTAYNGTIMVAIFNKEQNLVLAEHKIAGIGKTWKKFSCKLVPGEDYKNARLIIGLNQKGTVWIDVVSLFPPTFKNRANGVRSDIAQKIDSLHPKFLRFPGGCFVEGDVMANRFQWKNSIGNIENRAGHNNLWGYRTSDGLGYHEFLQFCEDISAMPLYVMNIGVAHKDFIPYTTIDSLIKNELDAIEYAIGPTSTVYGALRAANGHPEPFNLKYIEIGNENNQHDNVDVRSNHYGDRYIQFYNAIKEKYPDMVCIGNVEAWGTDFPSWQYSYPVNFLDEHYYRSPDWFLNKANKYDSYDRKKPKVYIGEYAVTSGGGNGNLAAALGEAAFMTGLERNSDVVKMASYAPLLANFNSPQWNPDLIYYNSNKLYGTPSYYVQKMFSNNIGDINLQIDDSLNIISNQNVFKGKTGVGSWATNVQYDSILVSSGDSIIVKENFDNGASIFSPVSGTWSVQNGIYQQTSLNNDCRSIAATQINSARYSYHLKAKRISGAEGFLIIFGYTDSNNFLWWNIGGWGNSQTAIERSTNGVKTTLIAAPHSIITGKWYDLKIDINDDTVYCYIDNELLLKHGLNRMKYLHTSCTQDTVAGDLYLKVVNFNPENKIAKLKFNNLKENTTLTGTLEMLTYSSLTAENSLNKPYMIAPATSEITISGEKELTFLKYSVSVFHLYPQSTLLQAETVTFSIPENTGNNTLVGKITGNGIFYRITKSSANAFDINKSSGEIFVKDSSLLNFEKCSQIIMTIEVIDNNGNSARLKCIVNINDQNEKPSLIDNEYNAVEHDTAGTLIGQAFLQDEDNGQSHTFDIGEQSIPNLLKINTSTGEIFLNKPIPANQSSVSFKIFAGDDGIPSKVDEKEFTLRILKNDLGLKTQTIKEAEGISVFPNPSSKYLIVKSDNEVLMELTNLKSSVISQHPISQGHNRINTSKLIPGIYLLNFYIHNNLIKSIKIEII